jgi:hypothetical protein
MHPNRNHVDNSRHTIEHLYEIPRADATASGSHGLRGIDDPDRADNGRIGRRIGRLPRPACPDSDLLTTWMPSDSFARLQSSAGAGGLAGHQEKQD